MSHIANDWIAHHAHVSPNHEALVDINSERRFSYKEMDERVSRAALFLKNELGVGDGDRVAVLAHNDSDVFEIQFACQRIGAIFLPLNWRLAVPELEYICNDASPHALLYGREFAEEAAKLTDLCAIPSLADVNNGGESAYEAGIASAEGTLVTPVKHLDDTWTVMYTSGTTGRPKGAIITYEMALYNAIHCITATKITSDSRCLVFLPTFHTGGLNVYANPMFHCGGTNIVMRTFDPDHFLQLLSSKDVGITHILGVPTNFLMLSQTDGFKEADLSHIVCLGVGGAAAPETLIETFAAKGLRLQQGWGMTETGPMGLMLSAERANDKIGSSGLPVLHTDLKVCNEDGSPTPRGEVGELLIRGPTVSPGYWNKGEENKQFFTEDGWFHTGDAARQDEDGYFYIVDRWKDMFISGGENVYPVEVENVIYQLSGVLENAVIGIPHEKWGEVGRAFVVLKEGANLNEEAVISHCKSQLATYKVPKQVRMIDELPHNATGKILKHQLPKD